MWPWLSDGERAEDIIDVRDVMERIQRDIGMSINVFNPFEYLCLIFL